MDKNCFLPISIMQENMGYVAQEGGLLEFLTVRQTFELFHGLHSPYKNIQYQYQHHSKTNNTNNLESGTKEIIGYDEKHKKNPWKDLIGSTAQSILPSKYLNYYVNTLSGGNRKKLSVAISNINDPSLLAIDECTSGTTKLYYYSHSSN